MFQAAHAAMGIDGCGRWSRAERGFAMMDDMVFKAGGWLGLALVALIFAALAVDTTFAVHMINLAIICLIALWTRYSRAEYERVQRGSQIIPHEVGVYGTQCTRWGEYEPTTKRG